MNDGVNGQLPVIDTQAGQLVAWAALEDAGGNHTKASLRKNFCSSEVYICLLWLRNALHCPIRHWKTALIRE